VQRAGFIKSIACKLTFELSCGIGMGIVVIRLQIDTEKFAESRKGLRDGWTSCCCTHTVKLNMSILIFGKGRFDVGHPHLTFCKSHPSILALDFSHLNLHLC